jgi:hypothetical protein
LKPKDPNQKGISKVNGNSTATVKVGSSGTDGDPVDVDVTMRAHAYVEVHIERLKDSGLCRFPF